MLEPVVENGDIHMPFFFLDAPGNFRAILADADNRRRKMILKFQGLIMAVTAHENQRYTSVHTDLACEIFYERRFSRASPGQIPDTDDRIRKPLTRQDLTLIKPAECSDPEAVKTCGEREKCEKNSARRIILLVLRQETEVILHAVHCL